MSIQTTEAIVLRSINFAESSKIVTFYTSQFGKIKGIAKGARSAKNKFGSSLEIFSHIVLIFYQKKTDIQLVSQCDLKNPFLNIRDDLIKTAYASYFIELINKTIEGAQESEQIFDLILNALITLETTGVEPEVLAHFFEIRLLKMLGCIPVFDRCVNCGAKIVNGKFSCRLGGILNNECWGADESAPRISLGTILTIRHLQASGFSNLSRLKLNKLSSQELKLVLESYIKYTLVSNLKSLDFLEQVANI
ncbi:DNA repair protein RecO [bacterium]|nr:DNA repair protein RecO [bacterium]